MLNRQEQLKEEVKNRLQKSFTELAFELNELQRQGVLTNLDKKKVMADTEISAQALRNALERNDYPEAMQRELVTRLIIQFENSVKDIVNQSRSKSYTDSFIQQKFSEIEKQVLRGLGIASEKQAKLASSEWERVKNSYTKRIKSLSKSNPFDISQIDYAFRDYENAYSNYATQQVPKIDAKTNENLKQSETKQKIIYVPMNEQRETNIKKKITLEENSSFFKEKDSYSQLPNEKLPSKKRKTSRWFLLVCTILLIVFIYLCSQATWLPKGLFHIIRFLL